MHAGINLPGAFENLIYIEMLLGVVHHLQNHPALARQTNAALTKNLDEIAGSFWSVDALASRSAMRRRGGHCKRSFWTQGLQVQTLKPG